MFTPKSRLFIIGQAKSTTSGGELEKDPKYHPWRNSGIIAGLTKALLHTIQSHHKEFAQLSHIVSSIASNGSFPILNLPTLQLPTFKYD